MTNYVTIYIQTNERPQICVYSYDQAKEDVILDAKNLALAIGEDWKKLSDKSLPVVYDSDEGPPSIQRPDSPTLSYHSSTKNNDRPKNANSKKSSGLFCWKAKTVAKKRLPTP